MYDLGDVSEQRWFLQSEVVSLTPNPPSWFENQNIQNNNIASYPTIYECEASILTLREECSLRVFENRIPRGIRIKSGEASQ